VPILVPRPSRQDRDAAVVVLQPDRCVRRDRPAIEQERHERTRSPVAGRHPVENQQAAGPYRESDLLQHLARAAVLQALVGLQDATRQRPAVTVVRLDQQDAPIRVGDQPSRGGMASGELPVPQLRLQVGHGGDDTRPAG
jgi:hypothetical protein